MKYEGKFVRINNNFIKLQRRISHNLGSHQLKIGDYSNMNCEEGEITVCDRDRNGYGVRIKISDIKDTPQELIQAKDLVEVKLTHNRFPLIYEVFAYKDKLYTGMTYHSVELDLATVTKIITPNSKDGYDLQYEELK